MHIIDNVETSDNIIGCVNLITNQSDNKKYCNFLSNRVGIEYQACDRLCDACKRLGPYNNKPISKDQEKHFVLRTIQHFNEDILKSVHTTLDYYDLMYNIEIPSFYNKLKENLNFLNDYTGFKKFTLTGPCITIDNPLKLTKIDVIIWFSSMKEWLDNKTSIFEKLPSFIDDLNVSFYIYTGDEKETSNLMFFQLDVENKIVYTSKWFELKLGKVPKDFKIRFSAYEYYDFELKRNSKINFNKPKPVESRLDSDIPPAKLGWIRAVDSWHKASSFINAVNSRGIISTALDFMDINKESGARVSDEIYNLRHDSCFGNKNKNTPPCEFLRKDEENNFFCGACGCASNKLAVLNSKEENGYSKLHYPHLQCPLKKPGFSNHETSN